MRALKSLLTLIIVFALTSSSFAGGFDKKAEEEAVTKTIERYVKSLNRRNVSNLEEIVYESATFVSINAIMDKVEQFTQSDFLDKAKSGRLGGWKDVNVSSVEVAEGMAKASLNLGNKKLKQTEFIVLFKKDNIWKIVSVVSRLEKK